MQTCTGCSPSPLGVRGDRGAEGSSQGDKAEPLCGLRVGPEKQRDSLQQTADPRLRETQATIHSQANHRRSINVG